MLRQLLGGSMARNRVAMKIGQTELMRLEKEGIEESGGRGAWGGD